MIGSHAPLHSKSVVDYDDVIAREITVDEHVRCIVQLRYPVLRDKVLLVFTFSHCATADGAGKVRLSAYGRGLGGPKLANGGSATWEGGDWVNDHGLRRLRGGNGGPSESSSC